MFFRLLMEGTKREGEKVERERERKGLAGAYLGFCNAPSESLLCCRRVIDSVGLVGR